MPKFRLLVLAFVAIALAALTRGVNVHAQSGVTWRFEDIAPIQYPNPPCVFGMTLAGFEYDPQGRPVLAWREENDCGGPPHVFWTRKEAGVWNLIPVRSGLQYDGSALDGYYGRPIALYDRHAPTSADDPEVLEAQAARVKAAVQTLLESARTERKGVFS